MLLHSGMRFSQIDAALDTCVYGDVKFLYLSPERLRNEMVQVRIQKMNVNLLAIDEDGLKARVHAILDRHELDYSIDWAFSGNPFLTSEGELIDASLAAIKSVTGIPLHPYLFKPQGYSMT